MARRSWTLAAWTVLACATVKIACTSYGGEDGTRTNDAGSEGGVDANGDAGSTTDAADANVSDAGPCDLSKDFGEPDPIPELSSPQQDF